MMVMARARFCFLAMTKTGSTAVERAFGRHAELVARRPPAMKHTSARTFDRFVVPMLEHHGHPRESYELVTIVREPVDWVHSWWRYRRRAPAPTSAHHTHDVSFAEFAERVAAGEVQLGSATNFVRTEPGRPPVDRIYRYEHLHDAVTWMARRLDVDVPAVGRHNASPVVDEPVSARTRRLIEEHYADDVVLHAAAR